MFRPVPKQNRVKDRKYLDSFRYEPCWGCGTTDGTVVGAHIRTGHEGGTGLKPSDDLVLPLCYSCHMDQEGNSGAEWWIENILKPIARQKYQMYLTGRK